MKHGTEHLNYGRNIIAKYCHDCALMSKNNVIKILDLGAGSGTDLLNCKNSIGNLRKVELYALESYQPNVDILEEKGIVVKRFQIEREKFPFESGSIDIVIMNQILEHTKEIFYIFSEVSRVLNGGGHCIVGVPNLASLHNRIALLFGCQPTCIRTLGPHVRGFTKKDFIDFIETDGYFRNDFFGGSNFYPFSPVISTKLSKVFPQMAVSVFFGIERTKKEGNFISVLDSRFFETPFFRG